MRLVHILFALVAIAVAAPAAATLDLDRADVSHLPNGLTLIMLEDHSFPLVSVQMLYKSGSAAEVTGKTGLAHFLEHLAFRGSANFPNAKATELIYDQGGEWHGYTAYDQTTYFATMPSNRLDLLFSIEADRMARVVIDPAAIAAEKGAVVTELHGYENDPASVLLEAVTRTAIQAHPYGSPMAGYVSDVERLTIEDARAYYENHYAPGNAVLAIVGDIELAKAKTLVAQAFSDIPARPSAAATLTTELPQRGERRTEVAGPVDRQFFQLAFHAPATSNADFPAFLVLQQILSGSSGLNLQQSDWAATQAEQGSMLFGAADDIATWLPPTRDPFLFTISGSISANGNRQALEKDISRRIAAIRDRPPSPDLLAAAKNAVKRAIADDVQTTEDAAHQLAFFEGIGALDLLLEMPRRVESITAADIQRVAQRYLGKDRLTVGWMIPGNDPGVASGSDSPMPAADRAGTPSEIRAASGPQLRRLSAGLPAIVQGSPLSDTVAVELLVSAPAAAGEHPDEMLSADAIVRSGPADTLPALLAEVAKGLAKGVATAEPKSEDPATRLEQVIRSQIAHRGARTPAPLAVLVSGNVHAEDAFALIERQFGRVAPSQPSNASSLPPSKLGLVREKIAKPLSQGSIGYVVEAPAPGTRDALAWRMLLYVLTHDYSGRLGNSAIRDKGLVYHIYSLMRTDGRRSWATITAGVDPAQANAFEAELRQEIRKLATEPPTPAEVDAARNHLLGRDLTAAQSNQELAAKYALQFLETGNLRSHEQLREMLESITPADLASIANRFGQGMIIRIDVNMPGPGQ
jgi:predicted Zn-dependent peptidase